jgi:serine/threonine-protein kinase
LTGPAKAGLIIVSGVIGETINNYRISGLIGEGGMGAVYLAEHPFMGRKAAIKVLRREFAEDPSLVERFMNEARAANAIRHPNIIDIIDVGRMPNGIPYLMMEFLEGESLSQRIARGTLPLGEAMDIMLQTTSALAAAHGKGIVHRDLKPDNLYLVPDDSAPGGIRLKVLDFGIAKLRGDLSGGGSKTQAGSLMGTPPYMSPEQCRGVTDEIDHRTDVYAMGIILYEMLCGAPPFVSEGWGDVVLAHLTKPPPSPRSRNSAIPESVEVIIMKALAKSVNDRFSSAAEMRTALRSMSAVGTFPPRPTSAGMSAMSGSTMSGMPAPKQPTTFRTATGEVSSINTMAEGPAAKAARSKRGVVIVGVSAAFVCAVGGGFVAMQGKGKSGSDVAPAHAVAPATTAPVVMAPAPAPAPKPAPRETPPPVPTQVLVRINSDPAGALVTDAKRGVVIGATPFEQRLERKSGTLGVRLAKDGFQPMDLEIPLGGDFQKAVHLERQKTHAASKPAASSSGKKAGAARTGPAAPAAPAAAPTTAPPPVTAAPPPVAKPKATEKW